jgi:hypothetical protein
MTINHNPARLLSLGIVAKELGLPQRLAKELILGGSGPEAIRVGRWIRVKRAELDRYKQNHPAAPAPSGTEAQS